MKATGIVRRMDNLGRVVIPKEIRRTMRMKEGDPVEIYVDGEGEVVLKRYSPVVSLRDYADEIADALSHALKTTVLITDRDAVIAVSGAVKSGYLHQGIGSVVEKVMKDRRTFMVNGVRNEENRHARFLLESKNTDDVSCFCIAPILPGGDVMGSVMVLSRDDSMTMGDMEKKLTETAADFLARQLAP